MKKIILVLFIIPTILIGQVKIDSLSNKTIYCEIVGTKKMFSQDVVVSIDYGQKKTFWNWEKSMITDSVGNVSSFNSMIDAMNYMSSKGWSFVQAYTVTLGNQNVYHYLLTRIKE